ncbi:MAG: hypothetical protein WDM71_06145 [Ferruginibacter sp.]
MAAGPYIYYVQGEDGTGCASSSRQAVRDTVAGVPTTSNAGGHQSMCSASSNTLLAANNPSVGVGAWTIIGGPSTLNTQFSDTTNHAATFTPAGGIGTYILTWTISNSPCSSSASN